MLAGNRHVESTFQCHPTVALGIVLRLDGAHKRTFLGRRSIDIDVQLRYETQETGTQQQVRSIARTEIHIAVAHIIALSHGTRIARTVIVIARVYDGGTAQEIEVISLHAAVGIPLIHHAQVCVEGSRYGREGSHAVIVEVAAV